MLLNPKAATHEYFHIESESSEIYPSEDSILPQGNFTCLDSTSSITVSFRQFIIVTRIGNLEQ